MSTAAQQRDEIIGKQRIAPDKVNRAVLIAALEAQTKTPYGEDAPDNDTIVTMLSAYYAKIEDETQVVQCTDCLGFSDVNLPGCPFCGAGDTEAAVDGAPTAAETAPKKGSKKGSKKAATPPKKNGAAGHAAPASTALAKTQPSAITTPAEAGAVVYSEKDLDEAVREINVLKGEGAHALWKLGRKLLEVFYSQSGELWRLRNNTDGKPKYKRFDQFVQQECGISKAHAYRWMGISREFKEEDVRRFGETNLATVITVPKEAQPELLALIEGQGKDGKKPTTREVQEEAKRIRERTGTSVQPGAGRQGSRTAAATAAAAKKKKDKRPTVSCLVFEGKQHVKLYTRDTAKLADEDKRKRAKKIDDGAIGVLVCSNAPKIHVAIQKDAQGNWVAVIEAKRDKDD